MASTVLAALLGKLAREALGQFRRQVERGKPPGPVGERELKAETALGRRVERQRDAELADAVIGRRIEPEDISGGGEVRYGEIRRRLGEDSLRPAIAQELGERLRRRQLGDERIEGSPGKGAEQPALDALAGHAFIGAENLPGERALQADKIDALLDPRGIARLD